MLKAAIYCRLSAEDRDKLSQLDDSNSIQNQKTMLMKHASCNGWAVYDIYIDDDYAGTDRSRPEFNRLLSDARRQSFDIVLCKSQSRFTREMELVEKYINGLFPSLGIRFISLVDCADTQDPGNQKARQINGLVNEWFLEELSENIRSVLTNRREQGYHIGSFAPYGYQKDPDQKGHLVIDPEAADIVRQIYSLFLSGLGKQRICRTLNEREIPNPTQYKRQHGMVRNKNAQYGSLWSYYTVANILTNEVYIGNLVQGRSGVVSYKNHQKVIYPPEQWIVVKGTHEPIIDQNTWDRVQSMIAQKVTPARREPEGIFARKLRCMYCGSGLQSVKSGNKRGFKCKRHALSANSCMGVYISLRQLERVVAAALQALSEELLDMEILEGGIDPFSDFREKKQQIGYQINDLQKRIDQNHAATRSVYLDKVKGIISPTEYMDITTKLSAESSNCEKRVYELTEHVDQIEKSLMVQGNKKQIIAKYVGIRTLSKEMVSFLIDHIRVGRKDPVAKQTTIEIHWNI